MPFRYQDRTRITPIGDLSNGDDCVVVGQIDASDVRYGRRRSLLVTISDDTGQLVLRFFHFSQSQQRALVKGCWIQCFGETRRSGHSFEMVHPEYRVFPTEPNPDVEKSLTPVYSTTEGIGPTLIRKLVNQALTRELPSIKELLPQEIQTGFHLMPLGEAIMSTHKPAPHSNTKSLLEGTHPAQQRLALEELLAHHLALSQLRHRREMDHAPAFAKHGHSWGKLTQALGFSLTGAQHRVIQEIFADVSQSIPSLRLVQGDVGSGKTVVAAAAALLAIDNGHQVALMAPTELLAEQHRLTFTKWFEPLGIKTQWLTGKLGAADRREAITNIASGEANFIIGTHALFQSDVIFRQLGLIIVDEQHRFGVDQRMALRNKTSSDVDIEENRAHFVPHQLIMSATPIPRSLAMIFYADLDVSSIDELPPGRKSVTTIVLPNTRRSEVALRIRHICEGGSQAYWVCPLIEESDKLQAQAATETVKELRQQLPSLRIELIHGRLKSKEKELIMSAFSRGDLDLLVATTVIEVGVDVPNATLMIIENAERLGLAQLHQLRGRVGRGADQASCVLMYQSPLGRVAKERLSIMRDTNDGFKIAQQDLEQRGPGELLGTRQTGLQQMQVADLSRDRPLLPKIERIAKTLIDQHPHLIDAIVDRWIKNRDQYANV